MKQKYFGNKIDEDDYIKKTVIRDGQEYTYETVNTDKLSGNVQEFYTPTDIFSARALNRPLLETFEDEESIYQVLQNVCKTLYGQKENGILPDIFEEFNPKNISVGKFLTEEKKYIRIPSGAFLAKLTDSQAKYYKYTKSEDNQYSKDFFIDNDRNSIVVFNRPNSDLFERQLAEHFNFNLNDQDNDVRLYYDFDTDKVGKVDEEEIRRNNPKNDDETDKNYEQRIAKIIESSYINNNNEKYNIKSILKYFIEVNKTSYSYSKDIYGKNIVTNTKETNRIPQNKNNFCYNSFELVNAFYNIYGSYLTKEDDMFSLEEVLEINFDTWNGENDFIIFFDPHTTEDKYDLTKDKEYSFSFSKRFGMCPLNSFDDNSEKYVKLFKIRLNVNKNTYEAKIIGDPICYLSKIDRTTFDIKNINLTNLLNDLVIENKKSNINISEAHIKPNENEKNNISIGIYNLGYSNTDGEKNRELDSEGDKKVLGENNIAIGSYSMKNTSENEGNFPKNNIAIGKNTLSEVNYGENNIEIGYGNEKIKNPYNLINIGSNVSKTNKGQEIVSSRNTTIIGHNNGNNFDYLTDKNTIIGHNNNGINSKELTGLSNLNTIIGVENNIKTLNNLNTIIGNYTNNDKIKDVNITENTRSLNFVIGNENDLNFVKNNNIIIGNKNYAKGSESGLNSNNVIIGKENYGNNSNFIAGNNNNLSGSNEFVVGNNNIADVNTNNETIIGKENTIKSTKTSAIIGKQNDIKNSESDYLFGYNNNILNTKNNFIIGNDNDISNNNNNIFIVKDAKITKQLTDAIVIGCGNDTASKTINENTKIAIGPIGGLNYFENDTSTTTKTSEYFINVGNAGDAEINAKEITINAKTMELKSSVNAPILNVSKFLYQDSSANKVGDIGSNAVPNAGNVTISDTNNMLSEMKNYKSFIGTYNNDNYIISVRSKNGYGNNENTLLLYSTINRRDNKSLLTLNISSSNGKKEIVDTAGGQEIKGTLKVQTLYATSSRKSKMDIKPTKYNAVDEINKINVVDFYFKSDEKKENPKVGFIADDTDPIFSTKEKNSMDLYNSVGMLFKAVQELSAENKELKERIKKLENK